MIESAEAVAQDSEADDIMTDGSSQIPIDRLALVGTALPLLAVATVMLWLLLRSLP